LYLLYESVTNLNDHVPLHNLYTLKTGLEFYTCRSEDTSNEVCFLQVLNLPMSEPSFNIADTENINDSGSTADFA